MILPLRADCLADANSADVAVVGAMMLWPTDTALRQKALAATVIEIVLQSGNHPLPTTADERREFINLVRTVPRVTDHDDAIRDGFRRGMIAGAILREVVIAAELRPTAAKMTAIKKRIASQFTKERISVSTINNNIWRHYRRVASYWAAFATVGSPSEPFPCRPGDLGKFLAVAEEFRQRAEKIHTPQSPKKTLLRPGETIGIPPQIRLPRGRLKIQNWNGRNSRYCGSLDFSN